MKRRDFIKNIFYTSSAASMAGMTTIPFSNAYADKIYGEFFRRTLVDVMLLGGADLRFLFVPHPDEPTTATYTAKFWESRKTLYNVYDSASSTTLKYPDYNSLWTGVAGQPLLPALYDEVEYNGFKFGIHKNAGWLREQFINGNVAIVCNVYGSTNRRHDHSQLIMHTGDRATSQFVYDRDGWGGRLAKIMGADANVVPVSGGVPPFANTTNSDNRLDQVVHVKDSRNFALPKGNASQTSQQSILGRALKAYYEKHGEDIDAKLASGELPPNWPYKKFLQHERSLRTFGDAFKTRLDSVLSSPLQSFVDLYKNSYNKGFALQCRNLFECLIGSDILRLRSAYMEYSSWDTHHSEKSRMEKNLLDVFGNSGGLATLNTELKKIDGANESLVYVFTSDFGRQIKVNGAQGTDHGEGTYMILLGDEVNGGIHGEMFPQSEVTPDANGVTRFDIQGADIEGKTGFEHVLSKLCDWVQYGSGNQVFPILGTTQAPKLEPNVDLGTLFNPGYKIMGEIKVINTTKHLRGVTVTATNQSGVSKSTLTPRNSHYDIDGLSNDVYLVTPKKDYYSFEPASRLINISNSDVNDVDFAAIPHLQITNIFYNGLNWADNTERLMIVAGYNFVPGQTTYTLGGQAPLRLAYESATYVWIYYPLDVTSGEITITTPTESYVHPVLIENL